MAVAGQAHRSRVASVVRCALTTGLLVPLGVASSSVRVEAAATDANVVTTTDDVVAGDGECSLREAIIAANATVPAVTLAGECQPTRLTIELQPNATYVVDPALPPIVSDATLNGNGSTIQSGAPLRVLQIGNDGGTNVAEIRDLALTHRHSVTGVTGRGLYVRSAAIVENLTVVDNREIGHGGGVYNENELEIIGSLITDNGPVPDGVREGGGIYNEAGSTLTISGTTISDNEAQHGGGIANYGTLDLAVSTLSANEALGMGGGLHNDGEASLTAPTIGGNSAAIEGGGVHNGSVGLLTVFDGEIAGNRALAGGGIRNRNQMSIDQTTVSGNEATANDGFGGGISTTGSPTEIVDSVIANNEVLGSSGNGGGIEGHTFEMRDSTVTGNEAGRLGGGIDAANATIERVTIDGNVAGTLGGGVVARSADIVASTISANTAGSDGGGIYLSSASSLLNSTVTGNTSGGRGGGVSSLVETTIQFSTITDNTAATGAGLHHEPQPHGEGTALTASIVAGNHGGSDVELDPWPQPDPVSKVDSLGYNVIGSIGDGVDGFTADGDLVDADAKLDPLADNGGPTLTHQPQPDSPAIDRVPSGSTSIVRDEQRGLLFRPLGGGADSGAIECCEPPFFNRTPTRIVDTRVGGETVDGDFAGDGPIVGDTVYEVQVAGRVPGSIVGTVVMNVTTVDSIGNGFLTIFDCEEQPLASSLNYGAGRAANNEVIAELDDAGRVCIYAKTTTHVVIDVVGGSVFRPGDDLFGQRMRYRPITPSRLLETRSGSGLETIDGEFEGTGAIEGDTEIELQITDRNGIVDPDATAVVVNLSTVGSLGNGFLTVYDCENRPLASGINYSAAGVVNNEIITSLSERGTICIYAKTTTHVVADAVGYLLPGSGYRTVTPARVLETRPGLTTVDGEFEGGGAIASDTMIEVQIGGRGGVTSDAAQATVNVSALTGVGNGFLTIWDCGDRPLASAINYGPGRVVNNEVIVGLSNEGTICIYAKTTAQVIVDVVGFSNAQLGAG